VCTQPRPTLTRTEVSSACTTGLALQQGSDPAPGIPPAPRRPRAAGRPKLPSPMGASKSTAIVSPARSRGEVLASDQVGPPPPWPLGPPAHRAPSPRAGRCLGSASRRHSGGRCTTWVGDLQPGSGDLQHLADRLAHHRRLREACTATDCRFSGGVHHDAVGLSSGLGGTGGFLSACRELSLLCPGACWWPWPLLARRPGEPADRYCLVTAAARSWTSPCRGGDFRSIEPGAQFLDQRPPALRRWPAAGRSRPRVAPVPDRTHPPFLPACGAHVGWISARSARIPRQEGG